MNFEPFKIREFTHWDLYLHENQYFLGRMYIWSKREGLTDLMDVTDKENLELFHIAREAKRALVELFQPDLFNWAALGNVSRQCHLHVIPRYEAEREFHKFTFRDENWNKNYAPYNYDFRTPEEVTCAIRDALKAHLGLV